MERQTIADFSLGEWTHRLSDVRAPRGAVDLAVDMFVGDDGSMRWRGPLEQKIATALTSDEGTFVWSGTLLPGPRALVGSTPTGGGQTQLQRLNAAQTALMAGLAASAGLVDSYTVVGNVLLMGCSSPSSGGVYMWGGSLKSDYAGATSCQRTAGSRTVTRAAGGFTANVDVGHIIFGWNGTPNGWAVVQSIESDTSLTVDRPSPATDSSTMTFFNFLGLNLNGSFVQGIVGSVAGRLMWMLKNRLQFTKGPNPLDGTPRTGETEARNVHEFPIDAQALMLATLRDRVFVGTKAGIYMVGGMAYEITDGSGNAQHPIEELTAKSVPISQKGVVKWQGSLIVPCRDGLYAMDGYGAPVKMSRAMPWAELVRDGLLPGFATVYKDRYLMPYRYSGQVGLMVFRTDGVDTSAGTMFPKTSFSLPNALAITTGPDPDQLLAVGAKAAGVMDGGKLFTIDLGGTDFDGSSIDGTMRSGSVVLGDKSVVRRVRARVSYLGTGDDPVLECTIVEDGDSTSRTVTAVLDRSDVPEAQWVVFDFSPSLECYSVQVQLGVDTGAAWQLTIHAIEIMYRSFGGR